MPVKSLHSSVKKWPDRAEVLESFRSWARRQKSLRPDISRIGCFGSITRGAWGFGSDLDIVIILAATNLNPLRRTAEWDTTMLPVAADVVVLTEKETASSLSPRFKKVLETETMWVEE